MAEINISILKRQPVMVFLLPLYSVLIFFVDINDPVIQKRADTMKMPLIIPMYLVGSTENIKVIKRFCVFAFQTCTDVRVFKKPV